MLKKRLILIFAVILSIVIVGCNDEESIEKKKNPFNTIGMKVLYLNQAVTQ